MKRTTVDLEDNQTAQTVAGEHDAHLKILERALSCRITQRGTMLILEGEEPQVDKAVAAVGELVGVIRSGRPLNAAMVESLTDIAVSTNGRASEVYGDIVWSHRGRQIGPRTVNQKAYVDAIRTNTITFGIGPAGTGKTYLATAMAVAALSTRSVGRIILTRPAVEAGESLGFLPGTVLEKVDPYFRPLFDALYDMIDGERLNSLMDKGEIEVAPLAFMRGRTLNDSFIILDEAQNTTPEQIKMFLTRLGFGSRMVVTGDVTQIDLPGGRLSGLVTVSDVLGDMKDISFVNFDQRDVVRHKLVQRIVAAYKEHGDRKVEREAREADERSRAHRAAGMRRSQGGERARADRGAQGDEWARADRPRHEEERPPGNEQSRPAGGEQPPGDEQGGERPPGNEPDGEWPSGNEPGGG
jgi:phosphate starvation-inducible protein PhoH and related proteins